MAWLTFDGTAWRTSAPWVGDGATARECSQAYVFDGSAWRLVFARLSAVRVTVSDPASATVGVPATVTGRVTEPNGVPVESGTVTLRSGFVGSGVWSSGAVVPVGDDGWFTYTFTPTTPGRIQWQATFDGPPTAVGVSPGITYGLAGVTTITPGSVSNSAASFSWSAVTGAQSYEVYRNNVLIATVTTRSYTSSGLSENSTFAFRVRARAAPVTGTVFGGFSATITARTGRPEIRDKGSKSDISVQVAKTGSWRPDVGWGYIGDKVAQGYYSDRGRRYWGVIDYGTNGVKNRIIDVIGADRYNGGKATEAEVFLKKVPGVGYSSAEPVKFYRTEASPGSGGQPGLIGSAFSRNGPSAGNSAWIAIGSVHAEGLANGNDGLCIYHDASGPAYQQFYGKSHGATICDLRITYAWDFVKQTQINPGWV